MHKYSSFLKKLQTIFRNEYRIMEIGEVFYDPDELVHTITCTFKGRTTFKGRVLQLYPRRLHFLFEITHLPRAHFRVSLRDGRIDSLLGSTRVWSLTEQTFKFDQRSIKDDKVENRRNIPLLVLKMNLRILQLININYD